MLPRLLKVIPDEDGSIQIRNELAQYFANPWHFHPELELTLILKSTGTRFVGDNIGYFSADDMVLIGSNLPHYWKNDTLYYENKNKKAEAIIIRFAENFIGEKQYSLPEMLELKELFLKAKRGILIEGATRKLVKKMMVKMLNQNGLTRLITFMQILNIISCSSEISFLTSKGFNCDFNPKHETRMNKVYQYLTLNFKDKLNLEEIAQQAAMNPSAFSRYFKQCTGKSVTEFLQELRLGYASKLLIQTNKNISEIIYESGFQSQTHFNKLFIKTKKLTPLNYRSKYQQ
jgi:AraC-like DNA-binding protein